MWKWLSGFSFHLITSLPLQTQIVLQSAKMTLAVCFLYSGNIFNLHLRNNTPLSRLWQVDIVIVSQWHCELLRLHFSECLPLFSPSAFSRLPAAGFRLDTKRKQKAATSKYWLGLRTATLSQPQPRPRERTLLFLSYSAAHGQHALRERQTERGRRGEWQRERGSCDGLLWGWIC